MSSGEFKVCPSCNEIIEASLAKCPHCLGSFDGQQVAAISKDAVVVKDGVKARIGLARLNGILLLFFGYGSGSIIVQGNFSHGVSRIMLGLIIVGVILVSGSLFGFLAAFNPASEMLRKLAKCANLMVVGMALFPSLRSITPGGHTQSGFPVSAVVSGFILNALIALPAVLNLRAFWKPAKKEEKVPHALKPNEAVAPAENRQVD